MRALPGTPVGGLFPPRLPSASGEGQPRMAEQYACNCNVIFRFENLYVILCGCSVEGEWANFKR